MDIEERLSLYRRMRRIAGRGLSFLSSIGIALGCMGCDPNFYDVCCEKLVENNCMVYDEDDKKAGYTDPTSQEQCVDFFDYNGNVISVKNTECKWVCDEDYLWYGEDTVCFIAESDLSTLCHHHGESAEDYCKDHSCVVDDKKFHEQYCKDTKCKEDSCKDVKCE